MGVSANIRQGGGPCQKIVGLRGSPLLFEGVIINAPWRLRPFDKAPESENGNKASQDNSIGWPDIFAFDGKEILLKVIS